MIRWTGYAACEETGRVYVFESDYVTKRAAVDNVERFVPERFDGMRLEVACFAVDSPEGEAVNELAEMVARDGVTGCEGVDDGYELWPHVLTVTPRDVDPVADLARFHGVRRSMVARLWAAYSAMEEDDSPEAFAAFAGLFGRLQAA